MPVDKAEIDVTQVGDRTAATALQIAYQNLIRLGWKFGAEDVGKHAREILTALGASK